MGKAKFHTTVTVPDYPWNTGYRKKNMFLGSCFTENVGQRMENLRYSVDINPFGILYNPVSVTKGLQILLDHTHFDQSDLVEHDGLWHSFYHHGRFSSPDPQEALRNINERIEQSATFLKAADFLFVTFGTAWVYRYNKTGKVVSNCHKIPAGEFARERLSVEQIVKVYREILTVLWKANPGLKVIFTVSPIRHWKDGAHGNQLSKATLLLATEQIVKQYPDLCAYFPSYEIVMDELRDYRFYASDMLHLNEVAIDHIWQLFEENLIDEESRKLSIKVQKIRNAMEHRPINPNSEEYLKFLQKLYEKTLDLEQQFPYLNLKLEKEHFIRQLENLGLTDPEK